MVRKLEIFVSSTFDDLEKERFGAINAVLKSGHIPVGMEHFRGQNVTSLELIKEKIDKCDAYLLILGARYGSLVPDDSQRRSYSEWEYDYAVSQFKPLFSIISSDSLFRKQKSRNFEVDGDEIFQWRKYLDFKNKIKSNQVEEYSNVDGIRAAISECVKVFEDDENLIGWVRGHKALSGDKINDKVVQEAVFLSEDDSFGFIASNLQNKTLPVNEGGVKVFRSYLVIFEHFFEDRNANIFNNFNASYKDKFFIDVCPKLMEYGLVDKDRDHRGQFYFLNRDGLKFFSYLERIRNA